MKKYISGTSGAKSDCKIEFSPKKSGGNDIRITSKVEAFYGKQIRALAEKTLADLGITDCVLSVDDSAALPFVIQARIEAAVKMAFPSLKKESLPVMTKYAKGKSSRERFRRSRLYLPGNQPKLMLNAGIHNPDGIILDLEDSVNIAEKSSARLIVRNALRVLNFFGSERMVRINQGDLGLEDLEAIIPHNPHLILIPKVEDAASLKKIDKKIQTICKSIGRKDPVFLMPIIESALGILNALEIAQASKNNVALAIGLEDYTADIGTQRTDSGTESFFARSMIVNAAKATGLQPIDTVYSDVTNEKGLRESVREAKSLGFEGKGCIHPRQILPVHEEFAPDQAEIEKAQKIVAAFNDAQEKGLGVVSLGNKMIDPPVVKRALKVVKEAKEMGII